MLHRTTDAFDIAVRVNLALHPVQFAFVVVELKSPNGEGASLSAGPIQAHAAEAFLESASQAGVRFAVSSTHLGEPWVTLLTELGSLHLQLIAEMKPRTIAALAAFYDRHPTEPLPSQVEVARRLGLKTRQAISDALSRGRFETLERIESAIRRGLSAW